MIDCCVGQKVLLYNSGISFIRLLLIVNSFPNEKSHGLKCLQKIKYQEGFLPMVQTQFIGLDDTSWSVQKSCQYLTHVGMHVGMIQNDIQAWGSLP